MLETLRAVDGKLDNVYGEVHKSWLSELVFGWVSDRFTTYVNRFLGLESASSPLWLAGFATLALLLLRGLLFFAERQRSDGVMSKVLRPLVTTCIVVYLSILTGSLFWLAMNVPDSPSETYSSLLDASTKLSADMRATTEGATALASKLDSTGERIEDLKQTVIQARSEQTSITERTQPATIAAIAKIERLSSDHLPSLAAMQGEIDQLRGSVQDVRNRQNGALWNVVAMMLALATAAAVGWAGVKNRWF
jgi:hypothetical protein